MVLQPASPSEMAKPLINSTRHVAHWLALAAASIALTGCGSKEAPQEPIRSVKVMTVGTDSFKSTYEYAGEVRARVESRLGFRVAGKIVRRQVELGQRVKAG